MNNRVYAVLMGIGLAVIAALVAGYVYLRGERDEEVARVNGTTQEFLTSWASGDIAEAYSAVCPEQISEFKQHELAISEAVAGYDGQRDFEGSLTVPFPGDRTLEFEATTHFADGTEGWIHGFSEKRDGRWCILGLEYSARADLASSLPTPTQSAVEPLTGQQIEFQWVETDGACNFRRVLSGSSSGVEFLSIRFRGSGFESTERVVVELRRDGRNVRLTAPLAVPPGGGTNNLCLYGPVQGQSPGGWPPGEYEVEFRLVGGARVTDGILQIE